MRKLILNSRRAFIFTSINLGFTSIFYLILYSFVRSQSNWFFSRNSYHNFATYITPMTITLKSLFAISWMFMLANGQNHQDEKPEKLTKNAQLLKWMQTSVLDRWKKLARKRANVMVYQDHVPPRPVGNLKNIGNPLHFWSANTKSWRKTKVIVES